MPALREKRRLAAILALDMVAYSRLMEQDEAGTLARLRALRRDVIEPLVATHEGRIVKLMGDGALCEFASVVEAAACAVAIQAALGEAEAAEEDRIRLRIGINAGDIIVEDGDIYGDGVNVASRLEGLADPGGIVVSGSARDEILGKLAVRFEPLGEVRLKNRERPVHAFRLDRGASGALARVAREASIVVLAFENLSADPDQGYFADGIAEDLITELARIAGLTVIARSSAFAYKGRSVDLRQVARELGVRHVLAGSVRRAAGRVRVTAQLVDGHTGTHVWAERYDREIADIFAVQDEITREIVRALRPRLVPATVGGGRSTTSVAAYDAFLRGREETWKHSREAFPIARALLEHAIALDPGFVPAHASLSHLLTQAYINAYVPEPEAEMAAALAHAETALRLDPEAPAAHFALGIVRLWMRDHDIAIAAAGRAVALAPGLAEGQGLLGLALTYAGRPAVGLDHLREAIRLDPLQAGIYMHFQAQAEFALGRFEDAAATLVARLRLNPSSETARVLLASAYGHLGRIPEARREWAEALRLNPAYSFAHRRKVLPYRHPEDFERIAEGLLKAGIAT